MFFCPFFLLLFYPLLLPYASFPSTLSSFITKSWLLVDFMIHPSTHFLCRPGALYYSNYQEKQLCNSLKLEFFTLSEQHQKYKYEQVGIPLLRSPAILVVESHCWQDRVRLHILDPLHEAKVSILPVCTGCIPWGLLGLLCPIQSYDVRHIYWHCTNEHLSACITSSLGTLRYHHQPRALS